jgi:DNA polymerase-1
MMRAIEGDIHLFVASQIYRVPMDKVTKEQRKRAKAINFGILFGAGGPKIAETLTRRGLHTSVTEGTFLVAQYHRRFPSIRKLMNELKIKLGRKGYITNPFGRRYHIDPDESYKCINYICQGTPADLMKAAMVRIWKWLREQNLKSRIILQVHDELVLEMPPAEERIVIPKVVELMEDRTSFFVPMTVDCEVAPRRWSEKIRPSELPSMRGWAEPVNLN